MAKAKRDDENHQQEGIKPPRGTRRPFIQRIVTFFHRLKINFGNLARSSTAIIPASVKASNSHLLKYTSPWTIDLWRQHAFKSQNLVESYELLEIQLFKNEFNVEHEFLIGMFKSPEEVIFIAVERSAWYSNLDRKATADDIIKAMNQGRTQDGSNHSNRSSISSSRSLGNTGPANDMVLVIRGPTTFDGAVERFMKTKISRYSRSSYLQRGTMKFGSSDSNIPSSSSPSSPPDAHPTSPVPNLMHFSYAAIAAHRTRLYYTPTGQNCYWYVNAILFTLKEIFPPSEPFTFHDTAGTWSFGLFKVSLGSLQKMDYDVLIAEYNVCVSITISVFHTFLPFHGFL